MSNTSGGTVTATIAVEGTAPQQRTPANILLAPWETRVLEVMADLVGHGGGIVMPQGGISLAHTGSPGAVLARMFISAANRGYSAASSFIDPETSASQRWHGSGLRLKNLDGTKLQPVLTIRNTSDQLSRVQGRIIYTGPDGSTSTIAILKKTITPGATRVFNLDHLIENANIPNAVTYGGIELEYDTPKGSVIASVQSVSQNGDHVFQVPIFDPQNMPSSAGGFPWKADGDYRTIAYIKNETDSPKRYTAHLTYEGGGYSLGVRELKAGETVAIDFRELRDNQEPDSAGNMIPLHISSGQIAWSMRGTDNRTLSGRSEQISMSMGIGSTYACNNCCPDSVYQGWINPTAAAIVDGASMTFAANQTDINCYGQIYGPYEPWDASWNSSDWNVASVGPGGNVTGVGAGTANIIASWEGVLWFYWGDGYCEPWPQYIEEYSPVDVTTIVFEDVSEVGTDNSKEFFGLPFATLNISSCGGERFGIKIRLKFTDLSTTITNFNSTVSSSGMFALAPSPVDDTYVEYYGNDNPRYTITYLRKVRDSGNRAVTHTLEGTSGSKSVKATAVVTLVCP